MLPAGVLLAANAGIGRMLPAAAVLPVTSLARPGMAGPPDAQTRVCNRPRLRNGFSRLNSKAFPTCAGIASVQCLRPAQSI